MGYYVTVIALRSPLLVRKRDTRRQGTEALENKIPGSTLAGSLLRLLSRRQPGCERYSGNPYTAVADGFSVADAYPIVDARPAIPAYSYTFRVKIKNFNGSGLPPAILCPALFFSKHWAAEDAVNKHVEGLIGFSPVGLVKSVATGTPIVVGRRLSGVTKSCYEAKVAKVEAEQGYDSVAVSATRGSAEVEMLYSYQALPSGTLFWTTISLPDNCSSPEEIPELHIGGLKGRGYGKATLFLHELDIEGLITRAGNLLGKQEKPMFLVLDAVPAPPGTSFSMLTRGWSNVRNAPKLSMPSLLAGAVQDATEAASLYGLELSPRVAVEIRFRGLVPPMGHVDLLDENGVPLSLSLVEDYLRELVLLAERVTRER